MRVGVRRPAEVANLLNAAFCSILIGESLAAFEEQRESGMPFPLSALILPIVLHKPTREALPGSTRTKMHVWLQNRSQVRIGFAARARHLVPYTKEAVIFGMQSGIIEVTKQGDLVRVGAPLAKPKPPSTGDAAACIDKAEFLGRWLAKAGDVSTIFAVWGIRP